MPSPSLNAKRSKSPPPSSRVTAAQREALLMADDLYLTRKTRRAISLATTLAFWFAVLMFASALFGFGAHSSLAVGLPDAQGTGLPIHYGSGKSAAAGAGNGAAGKDDVQLMAERLFAGYGGIRHRHGPGKVLGTETGYKARAMLRADDAIERMSAGAVSTDAINDLDPSAQKKQKRKSKDTPGAKIRNMWASYFGPLERAWEDERARRVGL